MTKTMNAYIAIVREFLDHPAFEDMPKPFQIKAMLASEAFDKIERDMEEMENAMVAMSDSLGVMANE